jgi:NAD(P)-dependent dehydrogenase (short-subunit alcohol dehydrogenase family)
MTDNSRPGGQVALVTGGAKRVGRAICLRLAEAGYAVAIHCNESVAEAEALAGMITAAGGHAAVISADLVDPGSVEGILPAAAAELGPVTLLVNNASMFAKDSLTSLDVATWNRQFSVNIRAPSVLAGLMAKTLPEGMDGAIINILDQRVWKLTPEYYSYTLSKAAMWTATRTMAQALAPAQPLPTCMMARRFSSRKHPARCLATPLLRKRSPTPCCIWPAPARSPARCWRWIPASTLAGKRRTS